MCTNYLYRWSLARRIPSVPLLCSVYVVSVSLLYTLLFALRHFPVCIPIVSVGVPYVCRLYPVCAYPVCTYPVCIPSMSRLYSVTFPPVSRLYPTCVPCVSRLCLICVPSVALLCPICVPSVPHLFPVCIPSLQTYLVPICPFLFYTGRPHLLPELLLFPCRALTSEVNE